MYSTVVYGALAPGERNGTASMTDEDITIFLSYAHDDDLALGASEGEVGFVTFLNKMLELKLRDLGANPSLRLNGNNTPYVTDGGHYIMNCAFGPIENPQEVAQRIDHVVGVVEHGLFLGFATEAIIAARAGVQILLRGST